MTDDFTIKISGKAGQGIQSISTTLARTFSLGGRFSFSIQDYESRIRGGHNFSQVRIKDKPVRAIASENKIHLLLAMDAETIIIHENELVDNGLVIYDGESNPDVENKPHLFSVPFKRLTKDIGVRNIMANTIATGAAIALVKFDINILEKVLAASFKKKGEKVVEDNIKAARAGYDYIISEFKGNFPFSVQSGSHEEIMLLMTGNEAIALGAIAAGVNFAAAYPMTPSTSVYDNLASRARSLGIITQQAEDEISALNMAIGAGHTGARAITTTSGGGFSLMVEALGLAGITETPCVIIIAQRPGPSTGLPTRTEQGDLLFAIFAGQGEFPRAVFAPRSPESAFYLTAKAFNFADKYQMPVIVFSDQHFADSHVTVPESDFNPSKIRIDRGDLITDEEAKEIEFYKRYELTKTGISPRAVPGQKGILVISSGDEHIEEGHVSEKASNRVEQHDKRLLKLKYAVKEISPPEVIGTDNPSILMISWGSTYGVCREALGELGKHGLEIGLMHFEELWPFPADRVRKTLEKAKILITVEQNATSQLGKLITMETGIVIPQSVLKYDGRPFSVEFIVDNVLKEVKK